MSEAFLIDVPPVSLGLQAEVVYVGSVDGMEAKLVPAESDLPYRAIAAAPVRGRSPMALARNGVTLSHGALDARRLLAELRPSAILGTGGYVCVPLFVAARMAGIPTIIYLPDVVPGLAVQALARLATVVACNVEDSLPFFGRAVAQAGRSGGRPAVVTGYPVRAQLFNQERATAVRSFGLDPALPVVFVYGGSRGARSINLAIAALLPHILPLAQIIHVCGREGDEATLQAAAAQLPAELQTRYRLYPYLHTPTQGDAADNGPTMTQAFGAADLAVCRSGASTMAELPAAALPAVLVPYPHVHQEENADYLVARSAAVKVLDHEMLGSGGPENGPLFQQIQRLLLNHEERTRMAERSRSLARPAAARHLAALLLALATSTRTER